MNSPLSSDTLCFITVVIPCRNEAVWIATCVASALAQEEPPGGFEVVVVDGMSEDGTWEKLQDIATREKKVRVIRNPGRIVPIGLNLAIRHARGDVIIRMDAHTEYAPDYVRQCVAALSETAADNVGGPARTRAESYRQKAIAAAYHSAFAVGGARFHNIHYKGYVDTVTYGCWLKQAFERFGYFDEELVRNQDDEHNLRIVRGGGKIYQDPKICSWYRPRSSLKALFHQYRQYGYWKVRVIQKHRFAGSWRHFVPGVFVLTLLVLALVWVSSAIWVWASGFLNSHAGIRSTVPDRVAMESLRVLSSLLIAYATALLIASFVASRKASWKLFPLLPVVFMCYHFAYGWGFLRGAWDFVVLGRKAAPSYTRLTRDPSNPEKTPNL